MFLGIQIPHSGNQLIHPVVVGETAVCGKGSSFSLELLPGYNVSLVMTLARYNQGKTLP